MSFGYCSGNLYIIEKWKRKSGKKTSSLNSINSVGLARDHSLGIQLYWTIRNGPSFISIFYKKSVDLLKWILQNMHLDRTQNTA